MRRVVADFLSDERFKKFRLIAGGAYEDRQITGISVVAPSNQESITTQVGHIAIVEYTETEGAFTAIIRELAAAGASACLVSSEIENRLKYCRAICDECGLPLIVAEEDLFKGVFLADFASFLWGIRRTESAFTYSDVSVELIDSENIMVLMQRLDGYINIPCAYRDVILNRTITASADGDFVEMVKTYPLRELQRIFYYQWVVSDGVCVGCLFLKEKIKLEWQSAINAALVGLRIHVKKSNHERITRKKTLDKFFKSLLQTKATDHAIFIERLYSAGIHKDSNCLVVAIKPDGEILPNYEDFRSIVCMKTIEKKISSLFENVFVMAYSEIVVCILMLAAGQQENKILERVRHAMSLVRDEMVEIGMVNYFIGCGTVKESLALLHDSAFEALRAVQYCDINDIGKSPVFWGDLDSFQIISIMATLPEARSFHRRILGSIIDHDKRHNGELISTLIKLEKNNWNIRITANDMSFHPNTIKYRLKKICELLSGDIEDSKFKFDLLVALRLHALYSIDVNIIAEED